MYIKTNRLTQHLQEQQLLINAFYDLPFFNESYIFLMDIYINNYIYIKCNGIGNMKRDLNIDQVY
jgi:hypothetical protein